ncbi:MAG: orotidine-5'-phosphate decarboxylase [Candidatus Peribacter sp.]|nr:orotidine-5'-phosphate decarboxylase [Candidatus Peribacter sp.]
MHFADSLTNAIQQKSPVCVGLDPALDKLPEGISRDAKGLLDFSTGIIDAVKDIAACVKPQMAYYEVLGWEGMRAFWETCAYAKLQGLLVIADGKRNDIGSTCDAYAEAYLQKDSPIDALTVSPYLGSDGIKPFIERCKNNEKGIFVLVKTSNLSSGELQDLPTGDETVHEHMAQLVASWGADALGPSSHYSSVGAVVGATYPEELKYLRSLMPNTPILIPGFGAQGGTAADVKVGFVNGNGAIVNSSRGIIFASKGKDWKEAAAKAAEKMKGELGSVLK